MSARKKVGDEGFGNSSACPLLLAGVIWRRVVINRESAVRVARSLKVNRPVVQGIARILRHLRRVPTKARLALLALHTPGTTREDIAEWFDEPLWWVDDVLDNKHAILAREYIPQKLEYYHDGYQPKDPTPEQIRRMCLEIRSKEDRFVHRPYVIPHLQRTGVCVEEFSEFAD